MNKRQITYRSVNKQREQVIAEYAFRNPGVTRETIAHELSLNIGAVNTIVRSLVRRGVFSETETITDRRGAGRRGLGVSINPNRGIIAAVEMRESDTLASALIDASGAVHLRSQSTLPSAVPDVVVQAIEREIRKLINATAQPLYGIGIARAGAMFSITGRERLEHPFDWKNLSGVLVERLERAFRVPVIVGPRNDLHAFAEYTGLRNRRISSLVYLSVGEGVGMGTVLHGDIYTGGRGTAGDIGHMIVQKDGMQCCCGNRGCLGTLATVPVLLQRMRESLKQGVLSSLHENATFSDLAAAFHQGDKLALMLVDELVGNLSIAIINVVNLISPEVIIVGGVVPQLGERFERMLRDRVESLTWFGNRGGLPDLFVRESADATLVGAGLMALWRSLRMHEAPVYRHAKASPSKRQQDREKATKVHA